MNIYLLVMRKDLWFGTYRTQYNLIHQFYRKNPNTGYRQVNITLPSGNN